MREKLWAFLNCKITLTILSFLFTTVLAGWVNQQYQELAWLGKKQFEILQRTLDQQEALTKELAGLMDDRLFWVQKVYWALADDDKPAYIKAMWDKDYYPTVVNWNRQLNNNLYRIKILTRLTQSDSNENFYTHEDDISYQDPDTVHGYYKAAHYAVRTLACCEEVPGFCSHYMDKRRCIIDKEGIEQEAQAKLQQLAHNNTEFLNKLQLAFDAHNAELNLSGSLFPHLQSEENP